MTRSVPSALIDGWRMDASPEFVSGTHRRHWRVSRGGRTFYIRAFDDPEVSLASIEFEFAVQDELASAGWPVPIAAEAPRHVEGIWWGLLTGLPGTPRLVETNNQSRERGCLLAELHAHLGGVSVKQRPFWSQIDEVVADPGLRPALLAYEALEPSIAGILLWHLDMVLERFSEGLLGDCPVQVIHGDFAPWNLLYEGETLSGVLDFATTHKDYRIADFALSWRGSRNDVVHGYDSIAPLSDKEKSAIWPVFWSWLFIGVRSAIQESLLQGRRPSFEWQVRQFARRSALFGQAPPVCPIVPA